jgi:hypothetical protein
MGLEYGLPIKEPKNGARIQEYYEIDGARLTKI